MPKQDYTDNLVGQFQNYMKKTRNISTSVEQAQIDLDALASLYLAFTDNGVNNAKASPESSART